MTQKQIDMAFRRSLKTSYKGLEPYEKRIVKAYERSEVLDRDIDGTYRWAYKKYGNEFREHPEFQVYFEKIYQWSNQIEKLGDTMSRLEDKYGVDRMDIVRKHRTNQVGLGYGGSF